MPQTVQIVPKYSFPYTETVINNNTVWDDVDNTAANPDTVNRYLTVFTSGKGIDNKLIPIDSLLELQETFGKSNYKKYGQPLMNAYAIMKQTNTALYAMRVMPDDAFYANNVLSLWYKLDESENKVYIKFTQKSVKAPSNVKWDELSSYILTEAAKYDDVSKTDSDGFTQVPLAVFRVSGRGVYGNNYRWRITPNTDYEKNYGFKLFTFQCLDVENGTDVRASYVGSLVTSTKTNVASFINDVIEDNDEVNIPMDIHVFEENMEEFYGVFKKFWEDAVDGGYVIDPDVYVDEIPDMDSFDPLFGTAVASAKVRVTKALPFIQFVQKKTAESPEDVYEDHYVFTDGSGSYYLNDGTCYASDGTAEPEKNLAAPEELSLKISSGNVTKEEVKVEDIDENLYSETENIVIINDIAGNDMENGSDGAFGDANKAETAVDACYIAAFTGQYDKLILSPRRIPSVALFDANFSMPVKTALVRLGLFRNDCLIYLDTNFQDSLSLTSITQLEKDFSAIDKLEEDFDVFANYLVSYNLHHYRVKEESTGKRVPVTITYFLASIHATHIDTYGYWIPMVDSYATLSGHVRNSLEPSIDEHEKDLKEILYNSRFNYFEAVGENTFVRATQSTSDSTETSDLTEENNVNSLMNLKRSIEADIRNERYSFTDGEQRQSFRDFIKAKYKSLIGKQFYSIDITYSMNEFEFNRSITHLYLAVKFRKLTKQTIVEIDVNKLTFDENEGQ